MIILEVASLPRYLKQDKNTHVRFFFMQSIFNNYQEIATTLDKK